MAEKKEALVTGDLPYVIFGGKRAELNRIVFSSISVRMEFTLNLDNEIRIGDVTEFEIVIGHYHLSSLTTGGYLIGDKGDHVFITWRVESLAFIKLLELMGFISRE